MVDGGHAGGGDQPSRVGVQPYRRRRARPSRSTLRYAVTALPVTPVTSAVVPILTVTGLTIEARTKSNRAARSIVTDVSFTMPRGEVTAIVGESGSGKSTICLAILRILASNVAIVSGSMLFE